MSLQSRLRQSAKADHETCDGRFCELKEHPEMEAIERIAELEAEQQEATERWVLADRKVTELEAENKRLEVYEALFNGMRGDYVKVKDEIQRLRELAARRGSTTAKGEH